VSLADGVISLNKYKKGDISPNNHYYHGSNALRTNAAPSLGDTSQNRMYLLTKVTIRWCH